jgi:hypothetical protein
MDSKPPSKVLPVIVTVQSLTDSSTDKDDKNKPALPAQQVPALLLIESSSAAAQDPSFDQVVVDNDDDTDDDDDAAKKKHVIQPRAPSLLQSLRPVLLPPLVPKHERKVSWSQDQQLQQQQQLSPLSPPQVTFKMVGKSLSNASSASALSSSTTRQPPVMYSASDCTPMDDSTVSPFDFDIPLTIDREQSPPTTTTSRPPPRKGNTTVTGSSPTNTNTNTNTNTTTKTTAAATKKIDSGDLLKASPYESEAETYILSALEDRDPTLAGRPRINTGASSGGAGSVLFSRVSEVAANLFLGEIKMANAAASETGSVVMSRPSHQEHYERGESSSEGGGAAAAVVGQDAATPAPTLQQGQTFRSESSSRMNPPPPSSPPPPTHRRQKTTEETLMALTHALDQVNKVASSANSNLTWNSSVHTGVQRQRLGTHAEEELLTPHKPSSSGSILPGPLRTDDAPSSADALAHNANILFQRKKKLSGSQTATSNVRSDNVHPSTTATVPTTAQATNTKPWNVLNPALWVGVPNRGGDKKNDGDLAGIDGGGGGGDDGSVFPPADVEQGVPVISSSNGNGHLTHGSTLAGGGGVDDPTLNRRKSTMSRVREKLQFIQDLQAFLSLGREYLYSYCLAVMYLILPATGIAFNLLYLADNPPTGKLDLVASNSTVLINTDGGTVDPNRASASWWILFICVRQIITSSLARFMQFLVVDCFCLGTRWSLATIGPMLTLLGKQWRTTWDDKVRPEESN